MSEPDKTETSGLQFTGNSSILKFNNMIYLAYYSESSQGFCTIGCILQATHN